MTSLEKVLLDFKVVGDSPKSGILEKVYSGNFSLVRITYGRAGYFCIEYSKVKRTDGGSCEFSSNFTRSYVEERDGDALDFVRKLYDDAFEVFKKSCGSVCNCIDEDAQLDLI